MTRTPAGAGARGDVTLRPCRPEDFPALKRVYESIAAEGRWIGGELPIDWESREPGWLATLDDERWLVLLAEVEGETVGWISVEHQSHGRAELGMGIVDGYRSMGVGTRLLAAAIGWSKHRGAHKLTLELWPTNDRARGLYRKFGFETEAHYRRHWRRNDGSIWDAEGMALVLDEDAPGGPPTT